MSSRKAGNKCSLPHCHRSRRTFPEIKLFRFPYFDSPLFKEWVKKCNFDEQFVERSPLLFLCDRHFSLDCIGNKYLKRGAVPSMHLSDNKEFISTEEFISIEEGQNCVKNEDIDLSILRSPSRDACDLATSDIKCESESDASHSDLSEGLANYTPTNNLTTTDNVYVPKPDWLLSLLVEMRDEIKSLKSEISDMKKEIIELKDGNKQSFIKLTEEVIAVRLKNRKHHDGNILNEEYKDLQKLPLGVMHELQKFDEELQEDGYKLRKFQQFVSKTGGDGPGQFLRAAVRKVFTDELTSSFSWKGTSIKPSAEKVFLITSIKNICHHKFNCTDKHMNAVLQRHFVHAKDRLHAKRKHPKGDLMHLLKPPRGNKTYLEDATKARTQY